MAGLNSHKGRFFRVPRWQWLGLATLAVMVMVFAWASSNARPVEAASSWYVATTGNDGNDCMTAGTACLTLQAAINKSAAGDTIHVAAGTYTGAVVAYPQVDVNKTLTLLGAQAGVAACGRAGAESVLSNSHGMRITASDVVIDGFTVQDSVESYSGFGIWMDKSLGVSGTHVVNNIIQDNIAGIDLANAGPSQALIQHNAFLHNNEPGSAFGTGIYTDQYAGGQVTNVLIDGNCFDNNGNAGVGFSSTDNLNPDSDIEISNNFFDQNGRGVYFYSTNNATVHDNCIKNSTVPTKPPGTSVAIGVFGDVNGLTILNNELLTGAYRGIRVVNGNVNPNSSVVAHQNNIVGFAHAGLEVDPGGHVGSVDATSNWWGSATGPTNGGNPGGTGDTVIGSATFTPWLVAQAPSGPCGLPTPTPTPNPVGGISLDPQIPGSSGPDAGLLAAVAGAAGAVALGGVWYARRRRAQ